jgi:phosphate transport system substrate-binding protein
MGFTRCGAALGLLIATALGLAACGGHSHQSASSTGPSSAQSVPVQCGGKKKLLASGSTAQKNAIEQFVYAYIHACHGYTLNYNADGSGSGMREFLSNQTDLAGSDSPMDPSKGEPESAAKRCGSPAWDLPTVFGPIAVTYNVSGVDSLSLDGPTTAKIFNGTITRWDDPAIKALNVSAKLPPTPVHVIFRSDESGTTDNFQKYLDAASNGAWGKGAGQAFNGGVGEGASGNDGTSVALQRTDGSITYNEWSYAVGHQLHMAEIVTSAGPTPVAITADTVGKTIAGVKFRGQGNDLVVDTSSFYRPAQTGSYPIVLVTYEIVCSKYPDSATGAAVRAFMQATMGDGQKGLDEYGYIPLPSSLESKLVAAVNDMA